MLFDKNNFQLGEWIAIYIFYINLTHLPRRERKPSVPKHLAVASSGAETDQSWAFQTVLSNPSYRSSMSPLVPNLYPDSLNPTAEWSASYFSVLLPRMHVKETEASILQSRVFTVHQLCRQHHLRISKTLLRRHWILFIMKMKLWNCFCLGVSTDSSDQLATFHLLLSAEPALCS